MKKRIAIYPGSFDPITNGHIDIIKRSLKVFDEVIVLVAINPKKKSLFDIKTRVKLIKEVIKNISRVKVDYTNGLTMEYASKHNAIALIRGIRAKEDFSYELALNNANKRINKNVETIFFLADELTSSISSSSIVELYKNGVDVTPLVPKVVLNKLKEKFN